MTIAAFRSWLAALADAEATVPARVILERLGDQEQEDVPPVRIEAPPEPSWREKLWTMPSETRLGVTELAAALGRPRSYIYARTGPAADDPLPHRKLDGVLLFAAGEVRAWIRDHETEAVGGPMAPPSAAGAR